MISVISDALLMRYADGDPTLTAEERRAVRQALIKDPALLERLEAYLFTGRTLASVVQPADDAAFMLHMTEFIANAPLGSARSVAPARSSWSIVREIAARLRQPTWPALAAPAAAGVLAVIALWLFAPARQSELASLPLYWQAGGLVAPPTLRDALERTPSGKEQRLADRPALAVAPNYSYLTERGEWCRRFELRMPEQGLRNIGVACRNSEGVWRLDGSTPTLAYDPQPASHVPATGPEVAALDAAQKRMMVGDRVFGAAEGAVIRDGWRKTSQ